MTTSEQIMNCSTCRNYAKSIDPINHDDLFQDAWLRIFEKEQRDPAWKAKAYKYYFYRTLKNAHHDRKKAQQRYEWTEEIDEIKDYQEDRDGIPCEAFLIEWTTERTDDEDEQFYKNIVTLVLRCKNTHDAIRMCQISKTKFFEYLRTAKQKIRNEYIKTTDNSNSDNNKLV